ncbi:MAG: general secretion pathway protein GspK [Phycisphaerales bacterium]|jgi:type II secretory pathway component PulK|nr:general secretion pathway protein GspK [Phycisphaerales bacterium]
MTHHPRPRASRPGFAMALALWAIALVAVILGGLQLSAWKSAAAGRESLARVRATWAARAGIENVLARLQAEAQQTEPMGSVALLGAIAADASGTLGERSATWRLEYTENGQTRPGIIDTHSRININLMSRNDLLLLPDMTEEIADAILDYIDADEEARTSGAEVETYGTLQYPYAPRNGPLRSIAELELVKGVTRDMVRGLDFNLDGVVSPAERAAGAGGAGGTVARAAAGATSAGGTGGGDAGLSAMATEGGWSSLLTASSIDGGTLPGGEPRVDLANASPSEVESLLGVNSAQAETITQSIASGGTIAQLISPGLQSIANSLQQAARAQGGGGGRGQARGGPQRAVPNLSREQIAAVVDRATAQDPAALFPGKVNINTASEDVLKCISAITPEIREGIIQLRDSQGGDVRSVTDLLDVQGMTTQTLTRLLPILDVRSNVFLATARGRDEATGTEVAITVEIDRSTLPVVLRRMVVR